MKSMLFREMSKTEITISHISDIRMVHIYEMTGSGQIKGGHACVAMAVYYGDNEQINLSELDAEFDCLVNKVFSVYGALEDKSVISMDETTRAFFDNGCRICREDGLERYYGAEAAKQPKVPVDSTMSRRFLPLVRYLVFGIYRTLGMEYQEVAHEYGWRGAGVITGHVGEDYKHTKRLVFHVKKRSDTEFSIPVSGFLDNTGELLLHLKTDSDRMEITYVSETSQISGSSSFVFDEKKVRETHVMYRKGEQIFFDTNDYENSLSDGGLSEKESLVAYGGMTPHAIYRLPFAMTYLLYGEQYTEGVLHTETFIGEMIWADGLLADVRGYTRVHNKEKNITITTNSVFLIRTKIRGGGVQTYFVPGVGNTNGRYRERLEGKYFYDEA